MPRSRKPPSRKRPPSRTKSRAKADQRRKRVVKRFRDLGYALAHRNDPPRKIIPLVDLADVEVYRAAPLGVYADRAGAEAALAEMRYAGRGSFSSGLAIGLAAVAVLGLGIVLCYVLFRRKSDDTPLASPAPTPQPIIIQTGDHASAANTTPPEDAIDVETEPAVKEPIEDVAAAVIQAFRKEREARIKSAPIEQYVLPPMHHPHPTCIASARYEPIDVVVRCLQPNNGYALIAFSPTELRPGGQVISMPAGNFRTIHVPPGHALFAKGSSPSNEAVAVSVAQTLR